MEETTSASAGITLIERRLLALPKLLRRADRKWEQDAEHVHRVRVATRRADAALAAYRPQFKPRRWKKVHRRVRAMRRAAREARMCDVHIMMLQERLQAAKGNSRRALAEAIRLTQADRAAAQEPIARIARRYPAARIERWTRRLIDAVVDDPAVDSDRLGLGHVTYLAAATRSAASADLDVPDNLHALRLATKKLRYGLEIFGPCLDLPVRKTILPRVKEAGDRLGDINDALELADRLDRYARKNKGGLGELAKWYRADQRTRRAELLGWWPNSITAGVLDQVDALTLAPQVDG